MVSSIEDALSSPLADGGTRSDSVLSNRNRKLESNQKRFSELFWADRNWRDKKGTWEDFYDGYQWTTEELEELRSRRQPDIVINRVKTSIDALVGIHLQIQERVKAYPRDQRQDPATSWAMSEALRYIDNSNNVKFLESRVLKDAARCGRGWFNVFVENDMLDMPEIKVRQVSYDDIVFDRSSSEYDLSDAQDLAHSAWMVEDEIVAMFPEKKRKIRQASGKLFSDQPASFSKVRSYAGDDYAKVQYDTTMSSLWAEKSKERIRVVNYWYRETEQRKVLIDPRFGYFVLDKDMGEQSVADIMDTLSSQYGVRPKVVEKYIRIAKYMTFMGNLELDSGESPFQNDRFPYVPFFAFRESKSGDHYGFIKSQMDPQKEINKRRSKALHILNSTRTIMEQGAVEDVEELRSELARPDAMIVKQPNREISFTTDTNLGNAQLEMYNLSSQELDQVTNITKDLMGQATNARSGTAIDLRRRQGLTVLGEFFSNWKLTKIMLYQTLIDFVQAYWSPEKAIRIMDDQQMAQFIPFDVELDANGKKVKFNDFMTGQFDLILEGADMDINTQDEAFKELSKLAQTGMVPPELMIEVAPLSYDTKRKLLANIQAQREAQAQAQMQMQAMGMATPQGGASGSSPATEGTQTP